MDVRLPLWIRTILAAGVSMAVPAIFKIILAAGLSWPLLTALVFGKILLTFLSLYLHGPLSRIFRILSALYTVIFTATVLAGILISPYSAYAIWFELVRDGEPRGLVSNVMVLLAAVLCSSLAACFLNTDYLLPIYGQLLVAAGLLALVYQTRLFYAVTLCLLGCGSIVISVRFVRPGNRLRNAATFALLFLALLSITRLPMLLAEPRGSRVVDDRLHPGLRRSVIALFPRFPLLYGIPGFGYGFDTDRLGSTPILSEAGIFEIRGQPGQRLYLRTGSYSIYEGRSWSKGKTAREVPIQEAPRRPEGSGYPQGSDRSQASNPEEHLPILPLKAGLIPDSSVRVTILAEYYTLIPFTLQTRAIYLPPEQIQGISGNLEEGYRMANPLRSQQSIFLLLDRSGAKSPAGSIDLQTTLDTGEKDPYLQLPGNLGPEIKTLAASLEDPEGETRATLRNIERFLARNYTYNLEADRTPAGADFVDTFLFHSKEGYCVHFASSFTVLARLNRIPTRYATGFLVTLPGQSSYSGGMGEPGKGIVTGLSAHAWPEVWLEDRGWIAWEATTAVNPSYYEDRGEQLLYEFERETNRLTNRQLQAILGREILSREGESQGAWGLNWQLLFLLLPLLSACLVFLWLVRRYAVLLLVVLRPDRSAAMRLTAKIAAARFTRDLEPPWKCGWVRWAESIGDSTPRLHSRAGRLLRVIQTLAYSDREFRRRDLDYLRAFYLTYCAGIPLSRG
jgi:transglutaminase-like putative cysteine protease